MSRGRRFTSVGLALLTILLLGFVVAVAARSLPGGPGEDAMFEFDGRIDIDFGGFFGWLIFTLAILGAVLLVYGIKEAKPRKQERKRNYLGLILGVIVFFLILRVAQPVADTLLNAAESTDPAETAAEVDRSGGGPVGWLFSLLIAAVVAAALTKVGMTVRESGASFDEPLPTGQEGTTIDRSLATPAPLSLGGDARARILNSYHRFEQAAAARGLARNANETTTRHAIRVESEAGLDDEAVRGLTARFSSTRFGDGPVPDEDADAAERLSQGLCEDLGR